MNVLIFPAGTEIGREIWLSLRDVKGINLFPGGASYENHVLYYNQGYLSISKQAKKFQRYTVRRRLL